METNELEVLVPPLVELTIGGETLTLAPLKVGQLPAFLRAVGPILQKLTAPEIDWLTLLGLRGDDLLTALAIATNKPRAWIDDLPADEAILLAAKVLEVNADFFTRTVLPKLDGLFTKGLIGGQPTPEPAGSTPSNG
ncbi:hypothetical protein EWI61_13705 [Methylolobus aquaticus]|nr:hypothetical protein EWI61_13705 [Methylolobus aquaticus]